MRSQVRVLPDPPFIMMSFEDHAPSVEEVIEALNETPGYEDGISVSIKLGVIAGVRDVTEEHYRILSMPFSNKPLGLLDIVNLVGGLVFPNFDDRTTPDEVQADVVAFVCSPCYEVACRSLVETSGNLWDIKEAFLVWKDGQEPTSQSS